MVWAADPNPIDPLLVPKSVRAAPHQSVSLPLAEFTKGEFRTVIGPNKPEVEGDKVKRVVCCSGKVAYDLLLYRGFVSLRAPEEEGGSATLALESDDHADR